MACCCMAGDLDPEQDSILVAIRQDFLDGLEIAGALALLPDFSAGARVIVHVAGLERQPERLGIHVRNHQQLAIMCIRHDRGDQAMRIEFRRKGRTLFEHGLVTGRFRKGDGHAG